MSNRLGGKQGTAYTGNNANQPPNWTFNDRDPNEYDIHNVVLGDMWLNTDEESVWILVSLQGDADSKGSLATWVEIESGGGGGGTVDALSGNTGGQVGPDGVGNINVVGDDVGITITGVPGTNTLTASLVGGGLATQIFEADTGTATPTGGLINIKADTATSNSGSSVSFSASGDDIILNVTDESDNTIIGNNSGNTTITGGDNTILGESSGVELTTGSDNTIIGGTAGDDITTGSNNIIIGSSAGRSLTTSDSNNTLIGDVGFAGATEFISITAGSTGTAVFHNFPGVNASTTNGGNIFIGTDAGNFTLAGGAGNASNNAVGSGALSSLTTGANNESMGVFALSKVTTGTNNIGIGHNAGFSVGGNTGLVTGTDNVLIGNTAGSAYTAAESSNIVLGTATGTAAESNVLRIGGGTGTGTGQINKAVISGIRGKTPSPNDGIPVFINSTGQLGTVGTGGTTLIQTVTGNAGGAVGPAAGNINIVGDGTTIQITGTPGTNTLTVVGLGGGGGTLSMLTGDDGLATVAAGNINIITDYASQAAGGTVLFAGAADTLTLEVSDADDNTMIGNASGNGTFSGTKNTGLGVLSGTGLTTGSNNSMIGYGAGNAFTTGSYNTFVGYLAGSSYTTSESSNIVLGAAVGTVGESNKLTIGAGTGTGNGQINKAFISGIRGITPATADGIPVFIGSAGQLGTVGNGGTTMIQTVTGNSGGAVGPASGNINIVGDGTTIQITGDPMTNTLTVVGLGGGGGDLSILAGDDGIATAAAGTIFVITDNDSLGAGSSVTFSGNTDTLTLDVTDTDNNTMIGFSSGSLTMSGSNNTALGVSCGAALTTGSSNFLVGNEAGSLITTGNGNFLFGNASSATMLKGTTTSTGLYGLGANGSVFLHNYGGFASGNTFVGYGSAGNFNAGQVSSSRNNTGCGISSLASLTTGNNNVAIGVSAGPMTTGSSNTLLGVSAGSAYTTSESSNICLGRSVSGTATESNALRIGAGTGTGTGQINKAFISGIRGITTGISNAIPVYIDSLGQLGTAGGSNVVTTVTGNSGGAVSATSGGNINIRGDGTTITIAGSPGTNTLTASVIGGGGGGGSVSSFFAYLTNDRTNVTGDGTVYEIIYDTLASNTGSDFNLGTSIYTAPQTGLYNFTFKFLIGGDLFQVQSPGFITITAGSKTFPFIAASTPGRGSTSIPAKYFQLPYTFYTNLDSGDTVYVDIQVTGTSKTVCVYGMNPPSGIVPAGAATGIYNFFGGMLVS